MAFGAGSVRGFSASDRLEADSGDSSLKGAAALLVAIAVGWNGGKPSTPSPVATAVVVTGWQMFSLLRLPSVGQFQPRRDLGASTYVAYLRRRRVV